MSTSSTTPTAFGIQRFARSRLLSLHDACVAVTQNPRQTRIEKSFEAMKSKKNKKRYLTQALNQNQYGQYLVDPTLNLFENTKSALSSKQQDFAGDQQPQDNFFFTAINRVRKTSSSSSAQSTAIQDLPRHVPRHVVQPLQEPPFSHQSPIARFSTLPLFAISMNEDNNSNSGEAVNTDDPAKSNNNNNNDRNNTWEIDSSHWDPFGSNSSSSWMPQIRFLINNDHSNNTSYNKLSSSALHLQFQPQYVLPTTLHVNIREKTLNRNQVVVNKGLFENMHEMKVIVGEAFLMTSHQSSSNEAESFHSDSEQTLKSVQTYVSFQNLAVPVPDFLKQLIFVETLDMSEASNNTINKKSRRKPSPKSKGLNAIMSSSKYWRKKLKQAGLSTSLSKNELAAVWWYYVWIHRHYSIRWLLDINHLFAPAPRGHEDFSSSSSSSSSSKTKQNDDKKRRITKKRSYFLPTSSDSSQQQRNNSNEGEIRIDEQNEETKQQEGINNNNNLVSQVMSSFTTRMIRDADNFGQKESREKSKYAKYDLGKRRRKGKQPKKMSSLVKRRLLKKQQKKMTMPMNHQNNISTQDSRSSSSSPTTTTPARREQKYNSAHEFILHRLALKFCFLKPRQFRTLVNQYRIFLHFCDVSHTNEKQLWIDDGNSNSNNANNNNRSKKNATSNKKSIENKDKSELAASKLVASMSHMSVSLPVEIYAEELKVWREWRLVYAFFPIFALKAAMFGSGLPLSDVSSSSSSRKSSLAKLLGFDFVLSGKDGSSSAYSSSSSLKDAMAVSDLVAFKTNEKPSNVVENISSSTCLSNSLHPLHAAQEPSSRPKKRYGFVLDPESAIASKSSRDKQTASKYHLSTELSNVELSQLRSRSGYWVFRNALPAIDPKNWWRHFVVSSTTCAEKWDTMTGQQRTLFDTLPMKRTSGERRSDPFFAFLRQRVVEASTLRKQQLEEKRREKRRLKMQMSSRQQQQDDDDDDDQSHDSDEELNNNSKFPFLEKDTNLPTTLGQICARARKDWNNMHPFEQAQYYDQSAIRRTFPDFIGFKKEDALLWKRLMEEEEARQRSQDEFEMFGGGDEEMSFSGASRFQDYFVNNQGFEGHSSNSGSSTAGIGVAGSSSSLRMLLATDDATAHHTSHLMSSSSSSSTSRKKGEASTTASAKK